MGPLAHAHSQPVSPGTDPPAGPSQTHDPRTVLPRASRTTLRRAGIGAVALAALAGSFAAGTRRRQDGAAALRPPVAAPDTPPARAPAAAWRRRLLRPSCSPGTSTTPSTG